MELKEQRKPGTASNVARKQSANFEKCVEKDFLQIDQNKC